MKRNGNINFSNNAISRFSNPGLDHRPIGPSHRIICYRTASPLNARLGQLAEEPVAAQASAYTQSVPFDVTDFPGASPEDRAASRSSRRLVAGWLIGVALLIWAMVVLGGATRLTGSGLSIMEWDPIIGALPPMSDSEWQRLFSLYKQIPQYELLHAHTGFGLDDFKQIFWIEWAHRLLGRLALLIR